MKVTERVSVMGLGKVLGMEEGTEKKMLAPRTVMLSVGVIHTAFVWSTAKKSGSRRQ